MPIVVLRVSEPDVETYEGTKKTTMGSTRPRITPPLVSEHHRAFGKGSRWVQKTRRAQTLSASRCGAGLLEHTNLAIGEEPTMGVSVAGGSPDLLQTRITIDLNSEGAGMATAIEWTTETWNPTTGCDRVSPGCDHCYAMTLAKRLKAMGQAKYQNDGDPRTSGPGFGLTCHPQSLDIPQRWRTPKTIFVNSMSDLFHPKVSLDFIRDVLAVASSTPQHQYQILTKRSKRLAQVADRLAWPSNVWMGVSVENESYAFRADHLRSVRQAAVRFLSIEPLVGPIDRLDLDGIDWVIVGGESGLQARPLQPDWVRAIRDQCVDAGVPFFFKQWGGRTPKAGGRSLDNELWDEMPATVERMTA